MEQGAQLAHAFTQRRISSELVAQICVRNHTVTTVFSLTTPDSSFLRGLPRVQRRSCAPALPRNIRGGRPAKERRTAFTFASGGKRRSRRNSDQDGVPRQEVPDCGQRIWSRRRLKHHIAIAKSSRFPALASRNCLGHEVFRCLVNLLQRNKNRNQA